MTCIGRLVVRSGTSRNTGMPPSKRKSCATFDRGEEFPRKKINQLALFEGGLEQAAMPAKSWFTPTPCGSVPPST